MHRPDYHALHLIPLSETANADDVVIPDLEFQMFLTYPLPAVVDVRVDTPLKKAELVNLVQKYSQRLARAYWNNSMVQCHVGKLNCHNCGKQKNVQRPYLEKLPTTTEEGSECAICYEEANLVTLRCKHKFHFACIMQWVEHQKSTCPYCRAQIFSCGTCLNTGEIAIFRMDSPFIQSITPMTAVYNRETRRLGIEYCERRTGYFVRM